MKTVILVIASLLTTSAMAAPGSLDRAIDASAHAEAFPHYWEQMFGSGHAALSLRESYRRDLKDIVRVTGAKYVRFHDIFHDQMGVYDEDTSGKPVYNFSYVDQVYDGLLEQGVRPFVELSFMPKKLAQKMAIHEFWYQPIVAPPKSWDRYGELIYQFTKHLVERYGIDEVSQWYFEVWNEPNIHFWVGEPKQSTYFMLYDHAARAVKKVSPRLRVGGPATAQAAWVDQLIQHTVDAKIPLDFVSTHVYANDTAHDVFGTEEKLTRREMVCRAVKKVHDQVKASKRPQLPLIWSEFNASWKNEPEITDALMMGPWLADTIRRCDGLVESMAYWSFSDVFEEQGVVKEPFYGGYGAIAAGGLAKPVFNAFALLHLLGTERIPTSYDDVMVTRRADGTLVVALWNLWLPDEKNASARTLALRLAGVPKNAHVRVHRVDATHGSVLAAYDAMKRPRYPTQAQLNALRTAAQLPAPQNASLQEGALSVQLPVNGLVVLEIK